MEDVISKYLAGESTPKERLDLENFLNASPDNRRFFDELKKMWNVGATIPNFHPNTDEAWENVKARLKEEKDYPISINRKSSFWMKQAAAIALLIGTGFLFAYFFSANKYVSTIATVVRSEAFIKKVLLPDSSVVWLNKKSIIALAGDFGKKERIVYLVGEAYFDVTHDKNKPFIIYTNHGSSTKVHGTSFNLKSRAQDTAVFLQVLSGEVEFALVQENTLKKAILKKGEAAFSNHVQHNIYRSAPAENVLAWKEHKLSFSNTPLKEVCATLEQYFSTSIALTSSSLLSCHFTGTFESPDLKNILEVLEKTMYLNYQTKGNKIVISGSGCSPAPAP